MAGHGLLAGLMPFGDASAIVLEIAKTLEQCVPLIEGIAKAARAVRSDIILLCHGGPIAEPEDAAYILQHCRGTHGFYGASSMERLPTERAIKEQTEKFTEIRFGKL